MSQFAEAEYKKEWGVFLEKLILSGIWPVWDSNTDLGRPALNPKYASFLLSILGQIVYLLSFLFCKRE